MLKIRIDTQYLDLAVDTELTITLHNPAFDNDAGEHLYSFPFRFPWTENNISILQNPQRLDTNGNAKFSASLEIEGLPFEQNGVLTLIGQAFDGQGGSAVFKNETADFLDDLSRIKINEILDTISPTSVATAEWLLDTTIDPPHIYTLSIGGVPFSYNAPGTDDKLGVLAALQTLINAEYPNLSSVTGALQLSLDAETMNDYSLGSLDGLSVVSVTTLGDARQQALASHVDGINNTPVSSHCFPSFWWDGFYAGNNKGFFQNKINVWLDGTTITNTAKAGANDGWEHTYIPFVKLPYVFQKIADQLSDISSWKGEMDDTEIQQLILFNNQALDQVYHDRQSDNSKLYLNGFKSTFQLNDHVPDITALDLLKNFLTIFALYFTRIGSTIYFHKKQDQLTPDPIDWTHLSEPHFSATRTGQEGFKIEYSDTNDLATTSGQLSEYTSGAGENIYTLPFHTVRFANLVLTSNTIAKLPITKQKGSSDEGGLGQNDYKFRLLFYRGLQPAANADTYPFATHDHKNYENTVLGPLSLDIATPVNGLYGQYHKGVANLIADGQPVKRSTRLSIHDILELRKWTNARRIVQLADGQMVGVIKSVQFKVNTKGMSVAIVEYLQEK